MGTDEIHDTALAEGGEELAESPLGGIEGCVSTEEGFKNGEDDILKIGRGNIVPVMAFEGSQHANVDRVVVEIEKFLPRRFPEAGHFPVLQAAKERERCGWEWHTGQDGKAVIQCPFRSANRKSLGWAANDATFSPPLE